jgi:hypothetical protein
MTPYIVMGIIAVGAVLSLWLVLHWDRQDHEDRKN